MTYLFRNNQEASNLQVELHRQDFNYNFSKDNSMMPLNTLSKRIESYGKPSFTPTFSLIHPVMQHSSTNLKMNQKGWNDFQPFQLPIQDLSMRLIPSMKQTVQSSNQSHLNFQEPSLIPAFAKKDAGQNSRREEEKEQFKIKADPEANEIVKMSKGS
mmetsp:Transcript_17289/g.16945  ORF Transcript_17289/g.16945 Transcript_17289/m.16945 type:complete len:157 (+) Transcript_17289:3-473(+)